MHTQEEKAKINIINI